MLGEAEHDVTALAAHLLTNRVILAQPQTLRYHFLIDRLWKPKSRTAPQMSSQPAKRQRFPRSKVGAREPMNILERTDSTTRSSLALPPARIYGVIDSSGEAPRLLR